MAPEKHSARRVQQNTTKTKQTNQTNQNQPNQRNKPIKPNKTNQNKNNAQQQLTRPGRDAELRAGRELTQELRRELFDASSLCQSRVDDAETLELECRQLGESFALAEGPQLPSSWGAVGTQPQKKRNQAPTRSCLPRELLRVLLVAVLSATVEYMNSPPCGLQHKHETSPPFGSCCIPPVGLGPAGGQAAAPRPSSN